MSGLSRRSFLKGAAIAAGGSAMGFSGLFGYSRVFGQDGDDAATILNLAATAETFACTHYYNVLTNSNIALTPGEIAILKSALDAERQHLGFLNANGAMALTSDFFFPLNIFSDRNQFSSITETAETAFVGAYLAATRRLAELGNPLLAATAAQVAVVEQAHLALIRQIGGRIPNHVSLGQPLFFNVSDAVPVLQGFLEGGDGFETTARSFPGNDAILDLVRDDGVLPIRAFVDPTLFTDQTMAATGDGACMVMVAGPFNVNLRSGAGTSFDIVGSLGPNETIGVDGQTTDNDGFTWYRTVNGAFVRTDIVVATGDCASLPMM
jgi:hypothetical protein